MLDAFHPACEGEETRLCFDWAQHERVSSRPTDFLGLKRLMTARALWGFTTDLNRLCKNSGFTFQQTEVVFGASDAGVN
jgi:hypothetical protein